MQEQRQEQAQEARERKGTSQLGQCEEGGHSWCVRGKSSDGSTPGRETGS